MIIPLEWMPPLMFSGLVVFMLIGYPVAFSLAAVMPSKRLAGWLLAHAGLKVPRGPLTVGPVLDEQVTAVKDGAVWRVALN